MSNHPTNKVEKLIENLNQRYELLIKTLRGTDLSEQNLENLNKVSPHTRINADDLRIAIDDFLVLLKEAKRYAK